MEESAISFKCRPFVNQIELLAQAVDYYYNVTPSEEQKNFLLEASRGLHKAFSAIKAVAK